MSSAFDPSKIVLPSEQATRALEGRLMFPRRTIWVVHISYIATASGLVLWAMLNRSALLTPVDPNFHAFMIGFGVFLGVLVAAVEREAWLLGIGGRRAPGNGVATWVGLAALVVASGFGGDFAATRLWSWQAFRGLHPVGIDQDFRIVASHSGRSGESLELAPSNGVPFSITCSYQTYLSVQVGEHLLLPVETGRGGAMRVTLPPLDHLRRI